MVRGTDYAAAERAVRAAGLAPQPGFPRVDIAAGYGSLEAVRRVTTQPGVVYVEMDRPIVFSTDTSHVATRGAELLDETDPVFDGTGISIAINDSGVDGNHPAFQLADGTSKVARNVKSVCPLLNATPETAPVVDNCFVDVPGNDTDTISAGGHGTHVAGTAAGVFDTAADGSTVHGAAPGATLIGISVGQTISVYAGAQGLYWTFQHHEDPCAGNPLPTHPTTCPPIGVVNNSWGPLGGGEFDDGSAVAVLQEALVDEGVVVVWAAGNDGGNGSTNVVNPPAQDPLPGVIGVANYDDLESGTRDGTLNSTSSRGEDGRPETYPDISAPGTNILQACTYALTICRSHGDVRYPWYAEISGTSMAAPHIAGIVAQLLQADPDAAPAEIEDALEDTAYEFTFGAEYEPDPRNPDDATSYDKGHGLVDAVAAAEDLLGSDLDGDGAVGAPSDDGSTGDGDGPTPIACTAETFTDPEGDANWFVVEGASPQSEPSLDVTSAWFTDDESTSTENGRDVTFHIEVAELPDSPGGTQGQGEYFDFNFSFDGGGYYVGIGRNLSEGEYAVLGRIGATGRETLASGLPVSFDPATDTLQATLPADAIANAVDGEPVIADGSELEGFEVVSRRDIVVFVPDADHAPSSCVYTVGASADDDSDGDGTTTAPTVTASASDERVQRGEEVTFTADAVDDDPGSLIYTWDLGDGTTASGDTVTHAYDDNGDYTVTVTVEDDDGNTASDTLTVTVRGGRSDDAGRDGGREDGGDRGQLTTSTASTSSPVDDRLEFVALVLLLTAIASLRRVVRTRTRRPDVPGR